MTANGYPSPRRRGGSSTRGIRNRLARAVLASCVGAILLTAGSAAPAAAEGGHVFDPLLSLTGGTEVSSLDPVADPGPAHPPKPFSLPCGVAIDPAGYVYVANRGDIEEGEIKNGRIDVFNPAGEFVVEIQNEAHPCGPAVDAAGNLYLVQEKPGVDGVVRYSPDSYPPTATTDYGSPAMLAPDIEGQVAVNQQTGHLFVPANERIREYSSAAEGNALLRADIGEGTVELARSIAVNASTGEILVGSLCPGCEPIPTPAQPFVSLVYVLDSTGALKATIDGSDTPEGGFRSPFGKVYPAVDEETGEIFVGDVDGSSRVYRFVPNGGAYEYAADPELEEHSYVPLAEIAVSNGATNPTRGNVYVTSKNSEPHLFAFTPEPETAAPVIANPRFSDATLEDVLLRAEINPGGAATSYRFEYVDEATYRQDVEELGPGHGFDRAAAAGAGSLPAGNQPIPVSAFVGGLESGRSYRFRVSASNHCKPSEPEALCTSVSGEVAFATYPQPPAQAACANEALRSGPSAALPECRAYELVTPPDTNGREPVARFVEGFDTELARSDGNGLLFMTYGGTLPGALAGSGIIDGYEATRSEQGWGSHLAGPTGAQSQAGTPGGAAGNHGYWLWRTGGKTDHGSLVVGEEPTRYVRQPDGSFRLVGEGPLGSDPRARGVWISPDGSHFIFTSAVPLADGASAPGVVTIYDRGLDGVTHVVSLKPGGEAPQGGATVKFEGASADGTAIAFTVTEAGIPTLYLRRDNAVTLPVATGPLSFAGLATDGSRLTYVKDGNIFSFEAASGTATPVGSGGKSMPVNVSGDGTRVYFVSTRVLGTPVGQVATKDNFYVWDAATGSVRFIAVLTEQDVDGTEYQEGAFIAYGLGLWLRGIEPSDSALEGLGLDPSRTTPDGHAIVFESRAKLTGYENAGHAEIYRYEAGGSPELICLSCNPTLAAASGDSHLQVLAAADDGAPTHASVPVRNISDDGQTVFFQTPEPLVAHDVDGVEDVYEWMAPGKGGCTRAGGCLALISSGHSVSHNYLFAATPSGRDVFFTSPDLLASTDTDVTVSVYDARVGGGFAESTVAPCAGEACKDQPTTPPVLSTPSSSSVGPSGNVTSPKKCRKGQRKIRRHGKVKCVRKHRKRNQARGAADRGGRR